MLLFNFMGFFVLAKADHLESLVFFLDQRLFLGGGEFCAQEFLLDSPANQGLDFWGLNFSSVFYEFAIADQDEIRIILSDIFDVLKQIEHVR